MKIACTTEHLLDAILTVERFTGRHITLPILSHILISADEKIITLNGTNLEMGIEYSVPGKVLKTGAITAPAKVLCQIIQSIPDTTVTLEAQKQNVTLHTPSSTVTVNGFNTDDFPSTPIIKREHSFRISSQELINALTLILPAVALSNLKPELSGVSIRVTPQNITLAATDSFRLAEYTFPLTEAPKTTMEFIVPARTMQEVGRTFAGEEAPLNIIVGEHQVLFFTEDIKILSRLIDGTYPPYQNLFSKDYETTLHIPQDEFIRKVRLASVFSSRLNDITLHYTAHELEVVMANSEAGSMISRVAVSGQGKSGSVVFNHRYLLDGISAVGGDEVTLQLNGVSGAALITEKRTPSFRYLVMPIRAV